jgi:hypothetical protein
MRPATLSDINPFDITATADRTGQLIRQNDISLIKIA